MIVLVTCKNEEDPIKHEGARVFTTLYINFPDAQGQITLKIKDCISDQQIMFSTVGVVLKILSGNEILTSIKGRNSITIL